MPRADVRRQILDAAAKLFYRHGVNGVGIDAILAEAKASSRSLYQHFGSRDGLALAYLERRDREWLAWLTETVNQGDLNAEARLLAIFDALEEWFRRPEFRGCAFINVAGEVADAEHPLRRVAARHKRALYDFIRSLAGEGDFDDPDSLAGEIFLLVEGAIVVALVLSTPDATHNARSAASTLIAARRRATIAIH
jgi:AcrR family transcriptional regulator